MTDSAEVARVADRKAIVAFAERWALGYDSMVRDASTKQAKRDWETSQIAIRLFKSAIERAAHLGPSS